MEITLTDEVWFWKGPSPWHFLTIGAAESAAVRTMVHTVTYGWGMVPCEVTIGETTFTTSLWPKDETYIVPLKKAIRDREDIEVGDVITAIIRIG